MIESVAEMGKGASTDALLRQAALGKARLSHDQTDCDDFAPAAGRGRRGENRVWCETCGRSLLVWGDADAE